MGLDSASNTFCLNVNFPLTLAPMVGISHAPMRMVIREYLPESYDTIWPTEMLSSRRLPNENLETTPETRKGVGEKNLVPQILGNEEIAIQKSVERLFQWGARGIDINMGCPVQKALKHNYGVALMGDAKYAAEVVKMTVRNSPIPVSVKLRAGAQNDFSYLLNFVQGLEDAGASWITLHPRTAEQKRRGHADWQQIRNLKKAIKIPVIGNGDVQTVDDAIEMFKETDCDMVMIGRALAARPWLFWQYGQRMNLPNPIGKIGLPPSSPEEEGQEYGAVLLRLIFYMRQFFSDDLLLRKFRFYVKTTSVWLPFGHHLYALTTKAKTPNELEKYVGDFFQQPISMSQRTELRQ